ncbi:AraC family transcriptional regulator [Rhizobium sp. Root274]|uniref:helix-turn-helix domain-containing protein n=1 Tax=unclassified Rhizobium TaxID=2613769 RepID=UPI000714DA8E|nr:MULTISPECIES: AraC family transcriptional regulator [unclassified Rhizobium]KQW26443.1 AraC family transcriptional regulator [Rhizobium sp. Root1240]KRD26414.1 AraC family transcriptional regulator [Rhizobium sp. Root274]
MDETSWLAEAVSKTEEQAFDHRGRVQFHEGPLVGFLERTIVRPGIALYRVEGVSDHAWKLKAQGEVPAGNLVVGAIINGAGTIDADGNERQAWRGSGRSYVVSLAERDITYHLEAGEPWRAVTLLMEPEALETLAVQNGALPPSARAVLDDGKLPISSLFEHNRAVMRTAHDILLSPYYGTMETLWRESKAMELLAHQFDHLNSSSSCPQSLNTRELARVKEAYDLLVADLRDPPGLDALAALVKVAPRRLNQGFREIYGMTVFEALLEARMKAAHALILERRDMPLKHLAWLVGYKQLSNFINAYKRRFGMAPGQLRRASR